MTADNAALVETPMTEAPVYGLDRLKTVDEVIEQAEYRSKNRVNLDVDRFKDLGVRWIDQDSAHSKSGYYARIDGRDMRFSDNAVRTASKLVKIKDASHWSQYPDKDAFPTTVSHILDNRRNPQLLVRHNGIEVNAVLPSTYQIKDAYEIISDFADPLAEHMGNFKGIMVDERSNGDMLAYRFIIGANIVKELDDSKGQFMMFLLSMSETGACPAKTALGLYRTICTNSAIREQLVNKWNHSGSHNDFYRGTMQHIRQAGYYQQRYSEIFSELLNRKLPSGAGDLLLALKQEKMITKGHYDASKIYADLPTEDGREHETEYDLFNLLTRGAQSLISLQARHTAEANALKICTDNGGISRNFNKASEKNSFKRKAPLA